MPRNTLLLVCLIKKFRQVDRKPLRTHAFEETQIVGRTLR